MDQGTVEEPKKKKSGCGCFGCGCLVIIAFFVLMIVGIYFWINRMVIQYSTETPIQLAEISATQEEYDAVEQKLNKFKAGQEGTDQPVPLVLTDREINMYIVNQPELNELADKIRVKIEGDQIGAQINVPLSQFGWPGRYISGEGTITASVQDGEASLNVKSLSFNGNSIPSEIMKELESKNLAEEIFKKPEDKKLLEQIEMVIVKNSKLIVVGKKNTLNRAETPPANTPIKEPVTAPNRPAAGSR